jgi:hypothetical protein
VVWRRRGLEVGQDRSAMARGFARGNRDAHS